MNACYAWYLASVVLVALKVNTFDVWEAFSRSAGSFAVSAPVLVALVALTGSATVVLRQGDRRAVRFTLFGCLLAVAALGLAL